MVTEQEQSDYAQVGFGMERLAMKGFAVSLCKMDDMLVADCIHVKVRGGVGATAYQAYDELIINMQQAGWL